MKLERHFIVLFFFLLGFLILVPLLDVIADVTGGRLVEIVTSVALVALILGALYGISGETSRLLTRSLALVAVGLTILKTLVPSVEVFFIHDLLAAAFLGVVILNLVAYLFRSTTADYNTICASLCAYLLMGIAWALVYSSMGAWQNDAFSGIGVVEGENPIRVHDKGASLAIYYSFVTLTTLGYGDITPMSGAARMVSALEALTGQIFLAVLVARLVGLNIARQQD